MRYSLRYLAIVLAVLVLGPVAAYAQASITGVVRDTSGAVLPGVTVEVASPALPGQVRAVVTDGSGQYRVVDLRPGVYEVSFTLPGFSVVRREGIELTGTFVATVNAELRVGGLEETITVTGETPVVDVQSTGQQRVLNTEVVEALPANRVPAFLAALVPGVTIGTQDVGGSAGNPVAGSGMTAHGSRLTDIRTMSNGVSVQSLETGQSAAGVPNMMLFEEVTIDSSNASAEASLGGVTINLVPREGSNTLSGTMIAAFANEDMRSDNLSADLEARGLATPNALQKMWDVNPGVGGPLKTDKLWFFASGRYTGANNYAGGALFNANAGNPNAWTYVPNPTGRPANKNEWKNVGGRVTWQATQKHKLAFGADWTTGCQCPRGLGADVSYEANTFSKYDNDRSFRAEWTAPMTSRLLLEAAIYRRTLPSDDGYPDGQSPQGLVAVEEQALDLTYRAVAGTSDRKTNTNGIYRFSTSYITGAHVFKVGFSNGWGTREAFNYNWDAPMTYRFRNGVPNRVETRLTDYTTIANMDADLGIFAQDRWTLDRLTLSYGVRFDYYKSSFPVQDTIGASIPAAPGVLTPALTVTTPETEGLNWKDVTPRLGLAYDLFGTGKTAVKASLNKYVAGQGLFGGRRDTILLGDNLNPINRLVTRARRSWNDANGDYVPDCDLTNPVANGECGAMDNANYGTTVAGTNYDPDVLSGWGNRGYNWEFSTGVQHELVPRVSLDVAYFRRVFGNFLAIDNRATAASDYTTYSITAPVDPALPGGGGYEIAGLVDLNPDKVGLVDDYITQASKFGDQTEHWNGVDITVNARPGEGMFLMGGLSTGRKSLDRCDVFAALPEMQLWGFLQTLGADRNRGVVPQSACSAQEKFLTQFKMVGSYTVPQLDVQISATVQSIPGPELLANFPATNAVVRPSLGRNLSGGARNITVNLLEPGTEYGDRVNQLDMRFGKILRLGGTRTLLSLDLYNVFNANPVLTENQSYDSYRQPLTILPARFIKINAQFDF